MDYEQKYKDALRRAKKLQETCDSTTVVGWCEYIFPELKESKDEQIRKRLIKAFGSMVKEQWGGIAIEDILAWIEKQGERNFDYEHADIPQNDFASKVEPKFKVGDWVVNSTTLNLCHILKVEHGQYICDDCSFPITHENEYHLWTIQDAKDGDILASIYDNEILIFRNLDTSTSFSSYYNITGRGDFGWSNMCFIPATKEQRDTLIKAMANAGYTFDFEKKELKDIESKTLDATKVIEWLRHELPKSTWLPSIVIDKFKKDFGL